MERCCEAFLVPGNCKAFVFSSRTRQWQAVPSLSQTGLLGLPTTSWLPLFACRQYAHGCFYWITNRSAKLLVLDARRMEFSMADRPPGVGPSTFVDIAIVEAGEGITGMFELAPDSRHRFCLSYIIGRNNGGSSIQWSQKQKILTLGSGSLVGSAGRHLFIEHIGTSGPLFDAGCCSLDIETFKLQRVHAWGSGISQPRVYSNFPPSVVITETINWHTGSTGQLGRLSLTRCLHGAWVHHIHVRNRWYLALRLQSK